MKEFSKSNLILQNVSDGIESVYVVCIAKSVLTENTNIVVYLDKNKEVFYEEERNFKKRFTALK